MIVCADDYGLGDDINAAILALAACRKLSAVSCMVALGRCTSEDLAALPEADVDVGLHLCLTTDEGFPLSVRSGKPGGSSAALPAPFRLLLARALTRRLRANEVAGQIEAQYELFLAKLGRPPDFIDGHLYVHQFPVVRDALLQFVLTLAGRSRPYIRNTRLSVRELRRRRLPCLKSSLIGVFGKSMFRRLEVIGLPTNRGFAGIYDFHEANSFCKYLPEFVACLPEPTGLLVVHPGMDEPWRRSEFLALRDFEFPIGSPHRFRQAFEQVQAETRGGSL